MMTPSIFGGNPLDVFMDDFFSFPFDNRTRDVQKRLYGQQSANMMKTDVQEHETSYEVDIDLPGFKKEDLSLELKDGYLVIGASREVDENETDESTGRFVRRERYAGSMSRSFYIGEEVRQEDIHAKYENGILKLSIPKVDKTPKVEEKKYIEIEG